MSKIPLIIYSRRRPMQLDLLLRSLEQNATNCFHPMIILKIDEEYKDGYAKTLANHYLLHCFFESDEKSLQDLTNNAIEFADMSSGYISWAMDDNVVYRKIDQLSLTKLLPATESRVASCRLGYNTIVQDVHRGTVQPPLNVVAEINGGLEWPIVCYNPMENYGYPFSLDFHIFRTSLIKRLLEDMSFKNSSELESKLTLSRSEIDYMTSFKESCTVNIPINSAGGVTISGKYHPISLDELNQAWIDGYEIDLENIMKQNIIGAHQELNLQLRKV